MFTDKQTVLAQAAQTLNRPDQPWEVTVEDDSIIARWRWMDGTFFAPTAVTQEVRDFIFTVTLKDDGRWKERDNKKERALTIGLGGVSGQFGTFSGKATEKATEFRLGVNNQTGEAGVVGFKFDTALIKQPIRDYLTACGWKKAGLFG